MPSIRCVGRKLLLTCGPKFAVLNPLILDGSSPPFLGDLDERLSEPIESSKNPVGRTILGSALSQCGKHAAFSDSGKVLSLWTTSKDASGSCGYGNEICLDRSWRLATRSDLIVFTHDSRHVLVADKSGDVFKFNLYGNDDRPELLLGHSSMLLDIVASRCGKFVVTCDRDEKIRVSSFPNSYNIHTVCLGHTEFVSVVSLLPSGNILVSGSGDGTVRTWRFLHGLELSRRSCGQDSGLKHDDRSGEAGKKNSCKNLKRAQVPAVVDLKCFSGKEGVDIAVVIENFNGILLYKCDGETGILSYASKVHLHHEVVDFEFDHEGDLLIVQDSSEEPFLVLGATSDGFDRQNTAAAVGSRNKDFIHSFFKDVEKHYESRRNLDNLYKRWYDNLRQYFETKEKRTCGKDGRDQKGLKLPAATATME